MRVIWSEDPARLREGLTRLLGEDGPEVVAAGGGGEAGPAVAEHGPDMVVADMPIPPTHTEEGLGSGASSVQRSRGRGVLVLSQYVETRDATELMRGGTSGGVGYLLEDRVAQHHRVTTTRSERVGDGGAASTPRWCGARPQDDVEPLGLTAREREVLGLMAAG